ncbi:TPA: helix-turn-helix transcriptional regulator [Streptococcus pneumoniae]|nr:helix-turn-helix transcriptional regulator [Streptococcus pneumoniae]HEU7403634.1 helix-turn-helix transcriptional regulator [Streptococcus pneumoniae]
MYRRLRDLREDHDLTQKQIATILSFTNSAYAKIERSEHALTADVADVLVKLSDFYDVSTDYLLGLTDFPDKIRFRK